MLERCQCFAFKLETLDDLVVGHLDQKHEVEFRSRLFEGDIECFEVPNLLAMNFLLHESLGGGGTLSLLLDAQGKTYAQYLLAAEVEVDHAMLRI